MKSTSFTAALALACMGWACTPALDWRQVRPEGSGLEALFPCKPAGHVRRLSLAGAKVEMALFACPAGGATYAVGFADVGDPLRVSRALDELSAAAALNIGASGVHAVATLEVAGMTPNSRAGRQALAGRLSDGQRVEEQVAVFAHGTHVFQVTVVGPHLDTTALQTFFDALRFPS